MKACLVNWHNWGVQRRGSFTGVLGSVLLAGVVACDSTPDNRTAVDPAQFAGPYNARIEARRSEIDVDTKVDGVESEEVVEEPTVDPVVSVKAQDRQRAAELLEQDQVSPRLERQAKKNLKPMSGTRIETTATTTSGEETLTGPQGGQNDADAVAAGSQALTGETDGEADADAAMADAPPSVDSAMAGPLAGGPRGREGTQRPGSLPPGTRADVVRRMQQQQDPDTDYLLDAMVGSVNGRPIYAATIIEPIDPQLRALASRRSVGEFRQQAQQLIDARLQQIVTDTLIYGEAERDLSAKELPGLRQMLQDYREKLIREQGEGSLMKAERTILQEQGITLDQAIENRRQEVVVRRYMQRKIAPKIVVTRRDIERFYQDNYDRFNPPPTRVVRLIATNSADAAAKVQQRLAAGESFEEVAQDEELNGYSPAEGGLWGEVVGEEPFGNASVNEALVQLDEGEHSGPIAINENSTWFLFIEEIKAEPSLSLREAQVKINRLLREQQFRYFSEQERLRLMKQGNYNSVEQMSARLLDIVMSRYLGIAD